MVLKGDWLISKAFFVIVYVLRLLLYGSLCACLFDDMQYAVRGGCQLYLREWFLELAEKSSRCVRVDSNYLPTSALRRMMQCSLQCFATMGRVSLGK